MLLAKITLVLYGLILIAGGGMGYATEGSLASLAWGAASGLVAIAAFSISLKHPRLGVLLGCVVALVVGTRMGMRLYETNKAMPAGAVIAVSVLALVIFVRALVGRKKEKRAEKPAKA
jgi:uncharacterized membrane protein (UPF0136 family)